MMRVIGFIGSTRTLLVMLGIASALLAYSTRVGFTTAELRTRDLCFVILLTMAFIGIGSAVVSPSHLAREVMGVLLMLLSVVRGWGFGSATVTRTATVGEFVGEANAVWAWTIIFTLGLALFARAIWDEAGKRRVVDWDLVAATVVGTRVSYNILAERLQTGVDEVEYQLVAVRGMRLADGRWIAPVEVSGDSTQPA